ncbi:pro-epidermal growth factor-like [Lytechinus pictus]|uniref:pro-epidermal growth factor-like n=1 Tax=Lytechinus pictus TaxID=7653 RepID=UPI0030B9E55A
MASQETNNINITPTYTSETPGEIGSTNTDYFPKTSDAHIEPCEPFYDGYCLHGGVCKWLTGIDKPSCDCISGYRGARCQYRSLATGEEERLFGDYWEVFIIGTIFGIVILLTLIGAIVYVVRKRKEAKTRRRTMEESADAFIQSNFQPGSDIEQQQHHQQQQPDNNQNKAADRYMRLPTNERYPIVETAVDSETLRSTTFGNSHPSSGSFRLQDPPFRKGSNHSTTSVSRESTV